MKYEQNTVRNVLGITQKLTDHVGIEIEVEGESLPRIDTPAWKSEQDNSLRGESYEYVLRKPVPFDKTKQVLEEMGAHWKESNAIIKNSPNAGVHVHINCSDLTITQLYNYIGLYLVVENLLISKCGEHRVGNLFCLRASDAEYLIDMLVDSVKEQDLKLLHTDDLRYASINVKALGDYGSLEFRAWRSDGDLKGIQWWCELLQHLKVLAKTVDNPSQIVSDVSELRPEGFYKRILGPFSKDFPWKESYDNDISDSVRRVQQFAYIGDW